MEEISTVNWLAIAAGTIVSFMLGGFWYSRKLFGEKWMAGVGIDAREEVKQPVPALISQLLGTFLLAWVIGILAASEALFTAILTILSITILLIASGLFSQKSNYAVAAEGGFVIAMAAIMIIFQHLF